MVPNASRDTLRGSLPEFGEKATVPVENLNADLDGWFAEEAFVLAI